MICKFCGNQIEDNSEFCFICGQKLGESADQGEVENSGENKYFLEAEPQEEQAENLSEANESYDEPASPAVKASKFVRFVCFLFAIIGFIIYLSKKKKGKDEEAILILNAIVTGLCVKMGVLIVFLGKKYLYTPAN